jgi:hypothetical protein
MTVPALSDLRAEVLRLPVGVFLAGFVVLSAALHAALALRVQSPWIVPDELIYAELAKSIAGGGLPAIRDEVTFVYGVGYPALIAPAWLLDDVESAYAVAKVLNAALMSLAAIPAYFLARRFVDERSALVVAALAVGIPSLLYSGMLLTEVALYPTFLLALLAVTAAVERPTLFTQGAALAVIALAVAIKVVAAVLVVAYVAAVVLFTWLETRDRAALRARLRPYAATWIALGAVALGAALAAATSGRSPSAALGAYAVVVGNVDVLAMPWYAVLHLAELDLYLAVIPFIATVVVLWGGLRAGSDRRTRLFAAVTVPTCTALILVVSAFASTASPGGDEYPENVARLHERVTFLLAPLFLIGLLLAFTRPTLSRPRLAVLAAVAAALPALIPLDRFEENSAFQALALVPWVPSREVLLWPLGCLVVTGMLALFYVARTRNAVVVGVVGAVFALTTLTGQAAIEWSGNWTRERAWGGSATWIDEAIGDRTASVLWAETGSGKFVEPDERHRPLWIGELFNRGVGDVYEIGTPLPYGLPATRARLVQGVVVRSDGRPAPLGPLVLVPCHVEVAGTTVAEDTATGAAVIRVEQPVRASVTRPGACPES